MLDLAMAEEAHHIVIESCEAAQRELQDWQYVIDYREIRPCDEEGCFNYEEPFLIILNDEPIGVTHVGQPRGAKGPDELRDVTKRIVLKVLHYQVAVKSGVASIGQGTLYDIEDVDVDGSGEYLLINGTPILSGDRLILSQALRTDTVLRVRKLAEGILIIYDEELAERKDKSFYIDMRGDKESYPCVRSLGELDNVPDEAWEKLDELAENATHLPFAADLHNRETIDEQISEYKERLKLIEEPALTG